MILFKKIRLGNKFLLIVLTVYALMAFWDLNLVWEGLVKTLFIFFKLIPILLLVLLVMFLINKYFKVDKVEKYLGVDSGWKGWFYAVISGILISGPPYILFPLLKDLKQKGMKNSLIAVFLYNRNVKIPFLPVMIYYFGLAFTVVISCYIILFSILNGLLIAFFVDSKKQ